MFTKYVFTSAVSNDVEIDKENKTVIYLSLRKLDSYLKGDNDFFLNEKFNIEMARFFTQIVGVENVVFELLNIDSKIDYSSFFYNIIEFITLIPEQVDVEIIEPDFNNEGLSSRIECSIFSNVSKMVSSNRSLTRLIKSNYKIKPIPTTIFGSCCSRDILSIFHKYNKISNFQINSLTMNVSFSTLFDVPLKYDETHLNSVNDSLKSIIIGDLEKSILSNMLQSLNTDSVVILDFLDERFDIVACNGSKVTKSWGFMNTKTFKGLKDFSTIEFDAESKIIEVIENAGKIINILKYYISPKNIIINESKLSSFYFDDNVFKSFDDGKYNISKFNAMHDEIIRRLKENFNDITFLLSPLYLNFGDIHHQWGIHPYHYNQGYYLFKVKKILLNSVV